MDAACRSLLAGLLVTVLSPTAFAVSPVSNASAAQNISTSNSALVQLLGQVQRLQAEVQALRGDLELRTHELEGVRKRQRDLYVDMDRRVHRLESGESTPPPSSGSNQGGVSIELAPASNAAASAEEPAYKAAFSLLKDGQYEQASVAFTDFLKQFPDGRYASNAQYWLSESSYVTRNFDRAFEQFKLVVSKYPDSNKVADAMLKIGYIQYEKTEWAPARSTLEDLRAKFPNSAAARLAAQRLERMRQEGH